MYVENGQRRILQQNARAFEIKKSEKRPNQNSIFDDKTKRLVISSDPKTTKQHSHEMDAHWDLLSAAQTTRHSQSAEAGHRTEAICEEFSPSCVEIKGSTVRRIWYSRELRRRVTAYQSSSKTFQNIERTATAHGRVVEDLQALPQHLSLLPHGGVLQPGGWSVNEITPFSRDPRPTSFNSLS